MSPRVKLGLIVAVFAAPIAASVIAYRFFPPERTSNYGELLLPPSQVPSLPGFPRGRWTLIVADSGACPASCVAKLFTIRQLRLAMGREADRVERVFVVDDGRVPEPPALDPFGGTVVVFAGPAAGSAPQVGNLRDRAHIYLADPHGNVMMRWPAEPDPKRMIRDLERLLKASQIG